MSRVNLEQIKAFLEVVRTGGVRKASVRLHITQPAVTARIKNLEQSLNCELFDRSSGAMQLTKRGELLFAHAEKFEHLSEMVERDVINPKGVERRLRLGVSETVAQTWLPNFVQAMYGLYPKIEIDLNVDISINLRSALMSHEIDLAILLGPISDFSVENVELPGFELAWYASANREDEQTLTDLRDRPILTYARNTRPFRELKTKLFEKVGPDVVLFPSSSLSACFRLVGADLGVAVLPRALGNEYVNDGDIIEFDPGWAPEPLVFTASFLAEPQSYLIQTAAKTALQIALKYQSLD